MSDPLPTGWTVTRLESIAEDISYGYTAKATQAGAGPRYLRITDIQNGHVLWEQVPTCEIPQMKIDQYRLAPGDLVFARTGATTGKSFLIRECPDAVFASYLIRVRCNQNLSSNFVARFFQSSDYWNQISENISGSAQPNCNASKLSELAIPLAPLNEQRRIVAKLEKLLAKVDACQKRLDRIPLLLKRFRQAVLAAACSGKLTADWRTDHSFPQAADSIAGEFPDVPDSWKWRLLKDFSSLRGGVTKGRKLSGMKTTQIPYLRVANVQDGYLDLSEVKTIEVLPGDIEKYSLHVGDVLFTEGGDRDKLGRGTIWKGEIKGCIHQNHIFRARVTDSSVRPEFLSLATKSQFSRHYFFENANQTVNLASMNLTTLSNLPVPLPPLEEQKEIVRRVNEMVQLVDQLEARYSKAKAHVDRLTQSILAKAFRGELVPQDPNDEPASVLLERIKAEPDRGDETPVVKHKNMNRR